MIGWYEAINLADARMRPGGLEYAGMAIGRGRRRSVCSARDRMMRVHTLFCEVLVAGVFLGALAAAGAVFWPESFDRHVLSHPIGQWAIVLSILLAVCCAGLAVLLLVWLFWTDLRLRGLAHACWAVFWTLFVSPAFLIGLLGMPKAIAGDVDRLIGNPPT